ncbi:hypothetical protein [Enterobacter asburiae]|uniref:hypothetical protein n=1 Tax=Enterobacter asburiae TaxID=61645 RepID=UPI001428D7A9|nr:hypothetical protein [Enterobacter asburiae]
MLWGQAGEGVQSGEEATAVIRVERVAVVEGPGENQLELPLLTSMYLGDRWEYLFRTVGMILSFVRMGMRFGIRSTAIFRCLRSMFGFSRKGKCERKRLRDAAFFVDA